MSLRLRGKRVTAELREFARWLETVTDVRHDLEVHVCSRVYGYFDAPGRRNGFEPYLVISLDDDPLDTFAHELGHYEQWRDGREITERGIKQRAAALVRRWRRERT